MRNEEQLRRALGAGLAPIALTDLEKRHMLSQLKGEKKMLKKRALPVLVIALVLLLTLTALAVTNWDSLKGYFETVRGMEASGELARWSDQDKLKLLSAMADAGLLTGDERTAYALDAGNPLDQRVEIADALIAERYGEDYFDSHQVEEIEFLSATPSVEEQAAYQAWDAENNANSTADAPITKTHTYLDAVTHLTEIGNFPRGLIRDVSVDSEYDEEGKCWAITASIDKALYVREVYGTDYVSAFSIDEYRFEKDGKLCFRFFVDEYGNYLGMDDVNSPARRANLSLEEALPLAEKALKVRLGIEKETLETLKREDAYGDSGVYDTAQGRFRASCTFLYRDALGNGRYLVDIDAVNGQVLNVVDYVANERMDEQKKAWMETLRARLRAAGVSDDLYNLNKQYFWHWSHDERAAWSRIARPIVRSFISETPEFRQYLLDVTAKRYGTGARWDNLIACTQFVYGVPDQQALPQSEVYKIAREEALKLGADKRYLDDSESHSFFYDVTDPERPLWKARLSVSFSAADKEHPYVETMPIGYFVVMDARTGEVLKVTPIEIGTRIKDTV